MFPSADPGRDPGTGDNADRQAQGSLTRRATQTAGLATLAGILVFGDPTAVATPLRSETQYPTPLPTPQEYRTQQLVLRNEAMVFPTADTRTRTSVATTPRTLDVRIDANIAFGKDSARLRPAAFARLQQVAADLGARAPGTLVITGHTDDLGSEAHGLELSRRRAEAVRRALGAAAAKHRVTVVGKGEAEPLVPNKDEASRARNRRVELTFRAR